MFTDTYSREYYYERFYEKLYELNHRARSGDKDEIEKEYKVLQKFADEHGLDVYLG